MTTSFDFSALFRQDLPPAAAKWIGFPKYNFVGGHNDAASVPVDDLIAAASRVLRREGPTLAYYGLNSGPLGYRPLRELIAKKLTADAGIACSSDNVLITSGSLQGLDLVNQLLLSPGDTVIVEQMTYGGAISRLKRLNAEIVGVPVDRDGLRADALLRALEALQQRGVRPKYIYTIPTVQNPTATVMSTERRAEIIALSRKFGVPIFEDDCYADLTWDGQRPPALRALANDGRVIYIGSFSKSIAPALRLGYLVADWPVLSRILALKTDAGSGALEQMVVAEYCQTHFANHLIMLRGNLRSKANALTRALRAQFGTQVKFDDPAGGIFLWVTLPAAVDTTKLANLALQQGIAVNPGAEWMTDAAEGRRRIRLCFASATESNIGEGIAQLARLCHREFDATVSVEHAAS
jgi:2-aminoadipate transaminase